MQRLNAIKHNQRLMLTPDKCPWVAEMFVLYLSLETAAAAAGHP